VSGWPRCCNATCPAMCPTTWPDQTDGAGERRIHGAARTVRAAGAVTPRSTRARPDRSPRVGVHHAAVQAGWCTDRGAVTPCYRRSGGLVVGAGQRRSGRGAPHVCCGPQHRAARGTTALPRPRDLTARDAVLPPAAAPATQGAPGPSWMRDSDPRRRTHTRAAAGPRPGSTGCTRVSCDPPRALATRRSAPLRSAPPPLRPSTPWHSGVPPRNDPAAATRCNAALPRPGRPEDKGHPRRV